MANLSVKNVSIAYGAGTVATAVAGATGAYLLQQVGINAEVGPIVGLTWFGFVGLPSLYWTQDALRQQLGIKLPPKVSKAGGTYAGRRVPINWDGGRQSHVLLSSIVAPWAQPLPEPKPEVELPVLFTVTVNDINYTITLSEIGDFLYKSWARQRAGKATFARKYWLQSHRPRLKREEYDARLVLLDQAGLIVDRTMKRSGKLVVPPKVAMAQLQATF